MGVPMGLQYSITAIGSVILQTTVNSMGESVIAAVSAGTKISMFLCCPFDAMGSTMATYGGHNVGAKKMDRVDAGLKACINLGIVYAILAFVFILLFGKNLALLFLDAAFLIWYCKKNKNWQLQQCQNCGMLKETNGGFRTCSGFCTKLEVI